MSTRYLPEWLGDSDSEPTKDLLSGLFNFNPYWNSIQETLDTFTKSPVSVDVERELLEADETGTHKMSPVRRIVITLAN